jgi:hypothetical protein
MVSNAFTGSPAGAYCWCSGDDVAGARRRFGEPVVQRHVLMLVVLSSSSLAMAAPA